MDEYISRYAVLRELQELLHQTAIDGEEQLGVLKAHRIVRAHPNVDVAPVVHGQWIATTKHKWKTKDDGAVDEFAWDREFHNGPVCVICDSAPCVHCRPGWEDDEGCKEHFACSVCGAHEEKKYPYCHCGAKMDGGMKCEND